MNPRALIPVTAPIDETDDSPLHGFWWFKRIIILSIFFIVFVLGAWFWLNHRAEKRLAVEIEQWKLEGIPLEAPKLDQPFVADEENAAVVLMNAVHSLGDMTEWYKLDNDDAFTKFPWSAEALAFMDKTTAINQKALAGLRAARNLKKIKWNDDGSDEVDSLMRDPYRSELERIHQLAMLTESTAMAAHLRGDDTAVLEYLHDLQFIAEALAQHPHIQARRVTSRVDWVAARMIGSIGNELRINTPALRTEIKARMARWLNPDRLAPKWLAVLQEGRMVRAFFDKPDSLTMFRNLTESERKWADALTWTLLSPNRMNCEVELLRLARSRVHAARESNWPAALNRLPRSPKRTTIRTQVEPLLRVTRFEFPFGDYGLEFCFSQEMHVKIAVIRLACRLYAIDHRGSPPNTLAELVPDYLPAIPINPLDPNNGIFRIHTATTQPFIYGLGISTDLVAGGAWLPTLAQHENYNSSIFVSFLDPHPAPSTTRPTTVPAR